MFYMPLVRNFSVFLICCFGLFIEFLRYLILCLYFLFLFLSLSLSESLDSSLSLSAESFLTVMHSVEAFLSVFPGTHTYFVFSIPVWCFPLFLCHYGSLLSHPASTLLFIHVFVYTLLEHIGKIIAALFLLLFL